MSAAWY